ncbi:hypothetical protein TYRP_017222 [Tyrophagus putrescentiae]|nr:hypothetical protein TYRP_017222 [Tyrophagus putrescentiae]
MPLSLLNRKINQSLDGKIGQKVLLLPDRENDGNPSGRVDAKELELASEACSAWSLQDEGGRHRQTNG